MDNNKNKLTSPQEPLSQQLKNDAAVNGIFGAVDGIGAAKKVSKGIEGAKTLASLSSGGIIGGVASGGLGTVANYYGTKISKNNYDKYMNKDNNVNLGHAAMIAAPAAIGSTYAFGAMMHGMDHGKKIFTSKNKLKALGGVMNPISHAKRGVKEIGEGFKAFNPKIKMTKFSRFLKGGNVLGLALSAIPAMSYIYNKAKGDKDKPAVSYNKINSLNTYSSGAGKVITKKASYTPFITALKDIRKHKKALKNMEKTYGPVAKDSIEYSKIRKNIENAKDRLTNDALGTAVVGGGAYLYAKKYMNNNQQQQPQFGDL